MFFAFAARLHDTLPTERLFVSLSENGEGHLNEAEKQHKDREIKIANNEADRQTMSDVRVSSWAVIVAVVLIGVAGWFLFAMR
jgi:hypothetical protein